jgi:hypothetical protein
MTWVLVIGVGWLLLAPLMAVVIGRSLHLADTTGTEASFGVPNLVVDRATTRSGIAAATYPCPSAPLDEGHPTAGPVRDTPKTHGIPVPRPPARALGRSWSSSSRSAGQD